MRLDSVAIASLLLFLDDTPLLLCRAFVSRVLLKQWTRCCYGPEWNPLMQPFSDFPVSEGVPK